MLVDLKPDYKQRASSSVLSITFESTCSKSLLIYVVHTVSLNLFILFFVSWIMHNGLAFFICYQLCFKLSPEPSFTDSSFSMWDNSVSLSTFVTFIFFTVPPSLFLSFRKGTLFTWCVNMFLPVNVVKKRHIEKKFGYRFLIKLVYLYTLRPSYT